MKDNSARHAAIVEFLSDVWDCPKCPYSGTMTRGNGKRSTWCLKYNKSIKHTRWSCVDRFPGIWNPEFRGSGEYVSAFKYGKLEIGGVEV